MAKKNTSSGRGEPTPVSADDLDGGEPAFVVGQWYQFAAPGGFLLFGRYVRELGYGWHRFVEVRHMRHAGNVELPQMCRTGTGPQTRLTRAKWRHWNGVPIWCAPWDADVSPGDN